jgi:hypothetical protein
MSLAMYAAPFDNNDNNENESSPIYKKNSSHHNKTQKKYSKESFDTNKVNSVLEKIHNDSSVDQQDDSLGDFHSNFTPPSMPVSTVQKPLVKENMQNPNPNLNSNQNAQIQEILGKVPKPFYDAEENLDLNNFQTNYGNQKTAEDYYKKYIPHYNSNVNQTLQKAAYQNTPGYYVNANTNDFQTQAYSNMSDSYSSSSTSSPSQEALMQKLNYMIHLLEEQQDEKTNHVTEEVVLYSFLGIFIIFIVDSFARVGKYVR